MTTKTSISLSPIKRSPNLKKRRLSSTYLIRQHQTKIYPTMITISYEKQIPLPDLVQDILVEQQRRKTIVNIANTLRKVGDQMDERLQINNTSSSISIDHIFGQRTITFVHCLSHVFRLFL